MNLKTLGWRDFFQQQLDARETDLKPARIWRQDINQYHLYAETGKLTGILPGRLRLETERRADLPTVGDWVLTSPADPNDPASVTIERMLDRFSKFSRKVAGERMDEQVVAANIDTVFIVCGLDDNFNLNRLERYLKISRGSGASPVVVLNKADLRPDPSGLLAQIEPILMGCPVHLVSARDSAGLEQISEYICEGKTAALLGSSGVGKSTIINRLLGYDRFDTGEVRENDSKGRHTTTFREMVLLETGGLLIDTPGMREIQIWVEDDTTRDSVDPEIEAYAMTCRFTDCRHETEPGCAVQEAIRAGRLASSRLESYRRFLREMDHFSEKQDPAVRAEKRKARRRSSKLARNRPTKRD